MRVPRLRRLARSAAQMLAAVGICGLLTAPLRAQRSSEAPLVFGSVQGTVTCVDTSLPARLTQVSLQPVHEPGAAPETLRGQRRGAAISVQRTQLDGTFLIPRVRPGRYYVVVQKPGYLSPVAQFTREEIDNPSNPADDVADAVAAAIPTVTVQANRASTVDIRLQRAATLAGSIRFDDGAPVPAQTVLLERKDRTGKWMRTSLGRAASMTDDQGHYRISGVPPGEYRMFTQLELDEKVTDAIFGDSSSSHSRTKSNLNVYFGDTFVKKDATILKIEDGASVSADLTIPNSKIHTVSGLLVEAGSGRVINAGTVQLFRAEDNEAVASVAVEDAEPVFRLPFVPEGNYLVRVTDAREVARVFNGDHGGESVTRTYGIYEGPLTVGTDLINVTLPIPPRAGK